MGASKSKKKKTKEDPKGKTKDPIESSDSQDLVDGAKVRAIPTIGAEVTVSNNELSLENASAASDSEEVSES